jgi:UDP-N-acetylmuramoyl-tripeptide--D-alanyl-D-alanine ligase
LLELDFYEASKAMGANLVSFPHRDRAVPSIFPAVSIDSRTIQAGEAFFALKGDRFDGHDFITQAIERGAAVVVASEIPMDSNLRPNCHFLRVHSVRTALQELARFHRKVWDKRVIAVTGSMGKTTTRAFTAALLGQQLNVLESPGNYNNDIGLPLSLLSINFDHELAVLELGMSHAGEIARLGSICDPDTAVITNVAPVHLEFFPDLDAIAAAKAEVLDSLGSGGRLVYNFDDRRVCAIAKRHVGPGTSFGIEKPADVRVLKFEIRSPQEMRFEIDACGHRISAKVPIAGRYFLYNISAAIAVALTEGIAIDGIEEAAGRLQPMPMRGKLREIDGITIWDDSYNSSPEAVAGLLETLQLIPSHQRTILVLGDMLELGPQSPSYHHRVGEKVAKSACDLLVTVGSESRQIHDGALEQGFPEQNARHYGETAAAISFLVEHLESGDLLIVKGSRGMKLDQLVAAIKGVKV